MVAPYNIRLGAGITFGSGITMAVAEQLSAYSQALLDSLSSNGSQYTGAYNAISGKSTPAQLLAANTTKSFTIEAWMKWDTTAAAIVGTVIGSPSDTARQPHFLCIYVDNTYWNGSQNVNATNIRVDGYFLSQSIFLSPVQFARNVWYHIAVSRDATNGNLENVWVNGAQCGSTSDSRVYSSNSLTLTNGWPNPQNNKKFVGYQSDVRVISNAFQYNPTAATITVPTAPLTSTGGNTIALIQANSGSIAVDNSPVAQTLQFSGISYNADSPYVSGGTGSWFNATGDGAVLMNPGVYNC
jgi:hypothetical protein